MMRWFGSLSNRRGKTHATKEREALTIWKKWRKWVKLVERSEKCASIEKRKHTQHNLHFSQRRPIATPGCFRHITRSGWCFAMLFVYWLGWYYKRRSSVKGCFAFWSCWWWFVWPGCGVCRHGERDQACVSAVLFFDGGLSHRPSVCFREGRRPDDPQNPRRSGKQ